MLKTFSLLLLSLFLVHCHATSKRKDSFDRVSEPGSGDEQVHASDSISPASPSPSVNNSDTTSVSENGSTTTPATESGSSTDEVTALDGGISSGGTLMISSTEIAGLTFANKALSIAFLSNMKAAYSLSGKGQTYIVSYHAESTGFVTLSDDKAPGLEHDLVFLIDIKHERLSGWENSLGTLEIVR